ncbi:hypothetical protein LA080_008550 [Diaporthe eres]|nr:hypothetical protein LA080_008550 [Diaporthe eres]
MELYASGFNAWGQLQFQATESHAEPDDLHEFTCVLTGDAIDRPRPSLSYTTVAVNGKVRTAGYLPTAHRQLWDEDFLSKFLDQSGSVRRYQSLDGFLSQDEYQTFPRLPPCQQLVAYETGFAALTAQAIPADEPGLVTALQDLPTGPISKIAAGGYVLAALTTGNDLYIWGGHPGRKPVPAGIDEEPTPVDIEENDIADVAVGETHIIVLTTNGDVFVIGENGNGQLGLSSKSEESWSRVSLGPKGGRRVVGVQAGPTNSFLLVHKRST